MWTLKSEPGHIFFGGGGSSDRSDPLATGLWWALCLTCVGAHRSLAVRRRSTANAMKSSSPSANMSQRLRDATRWRLLARMITFLQSTGSHSHAGKVYLQIKLCDPCLNALRYIVYKMAPYKYRSFSFSAHSDCCFFAPCTNILTYLLTYLLRDNGSFV